MEESSLDPQHRISALTALVEALEREVAARREAEGQLLERKARLHRLTDAAFEAIAITEKGVILEVNPQFCELIGYPPEEIIGRPALDFVAPEDRALVEERIRSGDERSYEHRCLRKDGTTRWLEVRGRQVSYQGRAVRATSLRDVSERKRVEELQRGLQSSGRLSILGPLAASIAHEVNNPLAFIGANSRLFLEGQKFLHGVLGKLNSGQPTSPKDVVAAQQVIEDFRDMFEEILSGVERVGRVVQSLQVVAGAGHHGETFELTRVLQAIFTLTSAHYGGSARLVRQLPDSVCVRGPAAELGAALLQVVLGCAELLDQRARHPNALEVECAKEGTSVVVTFRVSGGREDATCLDQRLCQVAHVVARCGGRWDLHAAGGVREVRLELPAG